MLLVACGQSQSPKDDFIARMEEQQTAKKASYQYSIKLEDIQFDNDTTDMSAYIGKEISGTVSQDLDKSNIYLSADLSALLPTLSNFEIIYVDEKAYMSADPIMAFSGTTTSATTGKYIDMEEFSDEEMPSLSELTVTSKSNTELYNNIDEQKFSKDGDDVSLTLSFNELMDFSKEALENSSQEDEETIEQAQSYLDLAKSVLSEDSMMTVTVKQNGDSVAVLNLLAANTDVVFFKSLKLTMSMQQGDYKEVVVPAASDILSQEEMYNLVTSPDSSSSQMTEEQFKEFYESVKESASQYTSAELQSLIDQVSVYLTREQISQLEGLLKETSDAK